MNEINNVLICGIGAVGSIYANKINEYSPENLRVLVDKNRYEKYIKNPKIFNGKRLDLNYILPDDKSFKADLIIVATKFNGLNDVIKNIENFVKDDTIIISLLNGIISEKMMAQKYGQTHILHSYFIGHSAMRKGNIITHDGTGFIVFGVLNPEVTDINDKVLVEKFFDKVGIKYKTPDDIQRAMWLKFMLNVSSNQTSAVLRMNFGQMQKSVKCRKFLTDVMQEVVNLAKAHGVKNTDSMIDEAFMSFDSMISEGKTSMLQDVEAGRKTEVEIFAGTVIELGKHYNIPTPYNKVLHELIGIIDG